jgi:hypothetical protein
LSLTVHPGIYLRGNIPATNGKELNSAIYKTCIDHFTGIQKKKKRNKEQKRRGKLEMSATQ